MEGLRRPASAISAAVAVLLLGAALLVPTDLRAQLAVVTAQENLRLEPNGTLLAQVLPGTAMVLEGRDGRWIRVTLEGWIWARSLQTTERGGFDLVVSAEEGENLRGAPQGSILARLEPGTLLEELDRQPGWIRARRTGWIWSESVRVDEGASGDAASPDRDAPGAPPADGGGSVASAEGAGRSEAAPAAPAARTEIVTAPRTGAAVLASPGGDTLARARAGTDVQVLERRGGWARVRVEGWIWSPPGGGDADGGGADAEGAGQAAAVTPADVRAAPERWLGRVVSWELQFVSLERAERVRTDFFENEPFLLTRVSGGQGPFVYVAVPLDRLEEMEGLTPLERLVVTGRIRVGSSALTGSPILDLLELRRAGR